MPTTIARHAGTVAALGFVLLFFLLAVAFTGCTTTRPLPQYTPEQQAAQRASISYWQPAPAKPDSSGPRVEPGSQADLIRRIFDGHPPVVQLELEAAPDSLPFVKVAKQPSFLRRLFPARQQAAADISVSNSLRKCKGCTFNVVAGNQTVAGKKAQVAAGDGATASHIEKKAGPAVVASDSSTQNALLGAGNLAAVHGDGNTLPQTTTTQQAADWRATLAKPAGYTLAVLGTVAIVGGCIFLIAVYKRRNLLNNNG